MTVLRYAHGDAPEREYRQILEYIATVDPSLDLPRHLSLERTLGGSEALSGAVALAVAHIEELRARHGALAVFEALWALARRLELQLLPSERLASVRGNLVLLCSELDNVAGSDRGSAFAESGRGLQTQSGAIDFFPRDDNGQASATRRSRDMARARSK